MSEKELYAVKNDKGEWSDDSGAFYPEKKNGMGFIFTMFSDRDEATGWAERNTNGGHVVTLIEEPKKVVLTKEQAKIVDDAHSDEIPAGYIFSKSDDEELLMNAYVNGYTVAKEKKYNVKVPKEWCGDDKHYWTKEQDGALTWAWLIDKDYMIPTQQFTLTEIEHYGLQDCEKVWCDSDD